jgi:hypothetical protein
MHLSAEPLISAVLQVEAKLLIAYGLIQQFHEPDQAN